MTLIVFRMRETKRAKKSKGRGVFCEGMRKQRGERGGSDKKNVFLMLVFSFRVFVCVLCLLGLRGHYF